MTDNQRKFTALYSYYDAVEDLPIEEQDTFLGAVMRYGLAGIEPEFEDKSLVRLFKLVRPIVDSSVVRLSTLTANGKRGGRPTKKTKLETNQKTKAKTKCENQSKNRDSESECDSDSDKDSESKSNINKKNINIFSSTPQCDIDGNENLFGEKNLKKQKPDLKLECLFYIWSFNRLTSRKFGFTPNRLKKFKTRRKEFSLEDLIVSVYQMCNKFYYLGKNEEGEVVEEGWYATPDWHLQNSEHITRFLEMDKDGVYRQKAKKVMADKDKWNLFLSEKGNLC